MNQPSTQASKNSHTNTPTLPRNMDSLQSEHHKIYKGRRHHQRKAAVIIVRKIIPAKIQTLGLLASNMEKYGGIKYLKK